MDASMIILLSAVSAFMVLALVWDVRTRRLPNWLTVPGLALGLLYHAVTGGWHGLLMSAAGFATGFGILLILWLMGGTGAGDVKLMGALGAWLGATLTMYVFVTSSIIVGVVGIATMIVQTLRRGFGHVHRRYLQPSQVTTAVRRRGKRCEREAGKQKRRGVLPYAVPLALATWVVLAWKIVLTQI